MQGQVKEAEDKNKKLMDFTASPSIDNIASDIKNIKVNAGTQVSNLVNHISHSFNNIHTSFIKYKSPTIIKKKIYKIAGSHSKRKK